MDSIFYVARDALIVVAILATLALSHRVRRQPTVVWIFAVSIFVIASCAVIAGIPAAVGFIGLRSYLSPLLLVAFLTLVDTSRVKDAMVRSIACVAIVNIPITVIQVHSSPSNLINKQVGDGTAYFVNPGDIVRASGTFSSPLGHTQMLPLALAAMLVGLHSRALPPWVSVPTLFGVALMTMLSGSRGAVVSCLIVIAAYLLAMILRGSFRSFTAVLTMVTLFGGIVFLATMLFPAVISSFLLRVDQASRAEDVSGRVLGSTFNFLTMSFPILGQGPGSASTAAQNLGAGVAVENDLPRWVVELGLLGYLLACARLIFGTCLILLILRGPRRSSLSKILYASVLAPVLLTGVVTLTPSSQGMFAVTLAAFALSARSGASDQSPSLSAQSTAHEDDFSAHGKRL
ncbi:hypothetical protein IFU40_07805 [Microbacterium sp. CFBP 13617]|uniref:O-antigen ligase family protein n=1 Tax=Microbacterium sp. CFBP 13617 TaxID=2774035 RepID=UPI0017854B4F|nr:hypothetical protein [Microbacterium sp. CFBP 13617]MBD8218530.1 hypothetical protein [Microbacterium sp. CFBP 13617]